MTSSNSREQLISSAMAAFEKKNYSEAVRLFEHVLAVSNVTKSPVEYAEARNNLSVAYLKNGQPQEALDQALGTESVFENHGEPEKQAMALGNIGSALVELRQYDQALGFLKQSADLFKQTGNLQMRSFVLEEVSIVQLKRGKQIESLFAMDAALEGKQQLNIRESFLKKLLRVVHRAMKTQ